MASGVSQGLEYPRGPPPWPAGEATHPYAPWTSETRYVADWYIRELGGRHRKTLYWRWGRGDWFCGDSSGQKGVLTDFWGCGDLKFKSYVSLYDTTFLGT
jgi:hypothetical protein